MAAPARALPSRGVSPGRSPQAARRSHARARSVSASRSPDALPLTGRESRVNPRGVGPRSNAHKGNARHPPAGFRAATPGTAPRVPPRPGRRQRPHVRDPRAPTQGGTDARDPPRPALPRRGPRPLRRGPRPPPAAARGGADGGAPRGREGPGRPAGGVDPRQTPRAGPPTCTTRPWRPARRQVAASAALHRRAAAQHAADDARGARCLDFAASMLHADGDLRGARSRAREGGRAVRRPGRGRRRRPTRTSRRDRRPRPGRRAGEASADAPRAPARPLPALTAAERAAILDRIVDG
jgi:hypothetical protein